ncbi:MAG: DUF1294 domain-containing protein [Lachnospiraceae bacterium]|nr:DUF1294 domain-containing protein [Lachnospiraceae bacterium]
MDLTLGYLLTINVVAFLAYGLDKYKAKNDLWRIPEATLITLAVIGGSIGALLGMRFFHHKTKKPKFYVGVPVILIVQIVIIILYETHMIG